MPGVWAADAAYLSKRLALYKLFLTLRYLSKRRIAFFAIAAVTLCVAMVLVVMSVMGGWLDQVKKRARGLLGDVIVDNSAYSGFPLYEEFIDEIEKWPEVARATPVLYTWGLVRFANTGQNGTVRVVGIRLNEVYEVNAFKSSLFYETYYPGTTALEEQQQPLLGLDTDAPPIRLSDEQLVPPPRLPEPYQSALERARREHYQRTGGVLDDATSTDSDMNELLRANGRPILPGVFDLHLDGERNEPVLSGNPLPGVIIGRDMIAQRESDGRYRRFESYPKGCPVELTLWATSVGGSVDPVPLKKKFRYADDSRTGIYEIDSQHVYVDFDLLQALLQMNAADRVDAEGTVIGKVPPRCSQIQIKLRNGLAPNEVLALCRRMEEVFTRLLDDPRFELDMHERRLVSLIRAMTWEQSQAHIIAPVEKERILVTILFGIISLVAVALVLCILYMIVLQKTRDIGIVKAVGASSGGVALIFLFYGAAVGVVGALLGTALGTLFVRNLNEIQDYLISINPSWRVWDLKVYSFDRIPSVVDPWDAAQIALIAVLAATAGSLAAAWRAGGMQPVEAIRYE